MGGESKNFFFFKNMQHNGTAEEKLINNFPPSLVLTDTIQIKVTLLASQPSLWPCRLCQHNLITSSLVTQRACLLMFPILCAFDSVFHFVRLASYAPQLQIANEELCLCLLLSSAPRHYHIVLFPLLLSSPIMCPWGDPKTVLHNLHWGDLLCMHFFQAEPVINLHWLSYQAPSTCAPTHLIPRDESTWNTRRTADRLMTAVLFPFSSTYIVFLFQTVGFSVSTSM